MWGGSKNRVLPAAADFMRISTTNIFATLHISLLLKTWKCFTQDVTKISDLDNEVMLEFFINVTWTDCRVTKLTNESKIVFDLEENQKPVYLPGIFWKKYFFSSSLITPLGQACQAGGSFAFLCGPISNFQFA